MYGCQEEPHTLVCVARKCSAQATFFGLGQHTCKQSLLGAPLGRVRILEGTGQLRAGETAKLGSCWSSQVAQSNDCGAWWSSGCLQGLSGETRETGEGCRRDLGPHGESPQNCQLQNSVSRDQPGERPGKSLAGVQVQTNRCRRARGLQG